MRRWLIKYSVSYIRCEQNKKTKTFDRCGRTACFQLHAFRWTEKLTIKLEMDQMR